MPDEPDPIRDPSEKPAPARSGDDDSTIPLAPAPPSPPPDPARPPAARPGVLNLVDDRCPNCKAHLDADAVVCMSCGFDMAANRVLAPEAGVDEIEPSTGPPAKPPFVKPGLGARPLALIGAGVLVAAMIAAAVNASPRAALGTSTVFALLVLYKVILHTGTGIAGLWAAAKFVDHRLNHLDLAAARMFVAIASFLLVYSLRIPIQIAFLEATLRFLAAVCCYWVVLFALFRRSRMETTLIALFHIGAVMFVEFGVQMAVWLQTSVSPRPGM